jgi:hypothetical protein
VSAVRHALVAALVALAGLAAATRPAPAQVRGQVVDVAGRPLPGVLVELWDTRRRLAGDGTDARGHFRLEAPPAAGPRALLARAIGLDPLRRVLSARDSVVMLVMQAHAIELAAATVTADAILCADSDDAGARALWERAASHYDVALSAYGVRTDVQLFAALVPAESLGVIDTTRLETTFIHGGYTALAFATRFASARNYYGVRAAQVPWRRYGAWHYQLLESSRAWHFADAFFATMNRLTFEQEPTGDTVIAFCSSEGTRPYIRGRLRLAPDTTFASAEWEFVTSPPREDAGGQVLFAPVDPHATGQPLMPIAGLFWRRVLRQVYQEWMEYRQWYRCESALSCEAPAPLRGDSAPPQGPPPLRPPPQAPPPESPPPR